MRLSIFPLSLPEKAGAELRVTAFDFPAIFATASMHCRLAFAVLPSKFYQNIEIMQMSPRYCSALSVTSEVFLPI